MSPKATTKHPAAKSGSKHNVPIVNVFDEDNATQSLQPARRPVVVEIEDVPTEMEQPVAPPVAPVQPVINSPFAQPEIQSPFAAPAQPQPSMAMSQPMQATPQEPLNQPTFSQPEPEMVSNIHTPDFNMQPAQAPQAPGMKAEPMLPSFFEQDLKNGMGQQPQPQPMMNTAPAMTAAPNMFADASSTVPQGVVGEINDAAGDGGSNKKVIGIILMVLAILILAIGGLFLYARNLFSPTTMPTPTPTVSATPRPTPIEVATPTPSASASALPASQSAALKKKVKVDVLNGTKTAGLAAKEAAVLKAAGFVMGTVGNGKPENAGTIVSNTTNMPLVAEIQSLLKDFTFKVTEDAKMTAIQVTLGE